MSNSPMSQAERRARSALPITRLFTAYMPVSLANWIIKKSIDSVNLPAGTTRQTVDADGVRSDWLIPDTAANDCVLLYLHGGGFIYSASSLHYTMLSDLAQKLQMRVLIPDYRLAPKHPFPTPLDDCVTAYQWLLAQGYDASNIVIAGDSAGGNLTITTLMHLRDNKQPMPAAAVGLSPVVDLSNKGDEFKKVHDPVLHPKAAAYMNQSYIGNDNPQNPLISPLFGDWDNLPPMLIHAGDDEVLRIDAERIADIARQNNLPIEVEIFPRMWHVWQINTEIAEAQRSLTAIAEFLLSHVRA